MEDIIIQQLRKQVNELQVENGDLRALLEDIYCDGVISFDNYAVLEKMFSK